MQAVRLLARRLPTTRLASRTAFGPLAVLRQQSTVTEAHTKQQPQAPFDFGVYESQETSNAEIPEALCRRVASLKVLHSRLNLGPDFAYSTLARALICRSANVKYVDNQGMANFGKSLLSFYVYEYFMVKYPRLPPAVLKHVVDLYTSHSALATVARTWGVEPDSRSSFSRYLAEQTDQDVLGHLLFSENKVGSEPGVVQVLDTDSGSHIDINSAMGTFVRALVSGVYAHGGLEQAQQFIKKYIVQPRKIDLASVMSFDKPTRELAILCGREGLESPVSRLLAETGRYSRAPVFVVGVFSGTSKLGEGQGASLNEARTRAAVNALKSWYLYSPVNPQLPSEHNGEGDFKPAFVDSGVVII